MEGSGLDWKGMEREEERRGREEETTSRVSSLSLFSRDSLELGIITSRTGRLLLVALRSQRSIEEEAWSNQRDQTEETKLKEGEAKKAHLVSFGSAACAYRPNPRR